ncbi:DUF4097 family beta strand repeat-containing protein [Streptomyces syringium]|uniref:DUF4097 family beta strand repeat-containing protein n=1 Tax=Streptomyces syringium TaxID=76729 RepID=UPI0037D24DE9
MLPRSRRRAAVRLPLVVGTVLAAGVALTGCGGAHAEDAEPERRTFSLEGRELTVDADNSELELVTVDAKTKDLKVTRWFDGWTVGGESKATWAMKDGTLKLREHCDGLMNNCASKHRIEVPRGVKVTVRDNNGKVRARGFETDLKVHTDNGKIDIADSKGNLDLSSSNGDVVAARVTPQRVKAASSNGGVRLALTRVPDRVEVSSDNGATKVELPRATYDVIAESQNGKVDVDVPRDSASHRKVTARSQNGEVTVRSAN